MNRERVHIIAEIGVNHNGKVDQAKRLIEAAVVAGADSVKFQYFNSASLASQDAGLAEYQKRSASRGELHSQLEMLGSLELQWSELASLESFSMELGIELFVSVFDSRSISEASDKLQSRRIKIPSGEIDNERLIREAAERGYEVLLSTGMASLMEVERSVSWFLGTHSDPKNLVLMQCTSSYPTLESDLNLSVLEKYKEMAFGRTGFSDHSTGSMGAVIATSLGVEFIEKHLTLDRNQEGPDHLASADPEMFATYVRSIRNAESALGNGLKNPTEDEIRVRRVVRKSPYALKPIAPGDLFDDDNIELFRPLSDLEASSYLDLMGVKSKRAYSPGEPIDLTELDS